MLINNALWFEDGSTSVSNDLLASQVQGKIDVNSAMKTMYIASPAGSISIRIRSRRALFLKITL